MTPLRLGVDTDSVRKAAAIIRRGGLVGFPTDTVYGLGADPFTVRSVDRLFEAKGREPKPVPVLCSDAGNAASIVLLEGKALGLANRYWPGALTIVARLRRAVPSKLDQGTGFLGVRVPDSAAARSLARELGGFVTGTSANISGTPSCRTAAEVLRTMDARIDAVMDGGRLEGTESTVVKVVGDAVEVLRRGAIAFESGITES